MKKVHEMKYSDIFKDPETLSGVERRNAETRARLLGNDSLRQIMQKSGVLISQMMQAEAPYKTELENLAVEMVKKMYPIIDEYNIEIEASLGLGELPPEDDNEEEQDEMPQPDEDQPDLKNDEVAKRRLINAITQGASVKSLMEMFQIFRSHLDEINPALYDQYNQIMNNTFGIYDFAVPIKPKNAVPNTITTILTPGTSYGIKPSRNVKTL